MVHLVELPMTSPILINFFCKPQRAKCFMLHSLNVGFISLLQLPPEATSLPLLSSSRTSHHQFSISTSMRSIIMNMNIKSWGLKSIESNPPHPQRIRITGPLPLFLQLLHPPDKRPDGDRPDHRAQSDRPDDDKVDL